jgi:hypothetical protein
MIVPQMVTTSEYRYLRLQGLESVSQKRASELRDAY